MPRPKVKVPRPAATKPARDASPPPGRATLSNVAKAAGVSLMTASYAMRNNPKISRPTRDRVHRAAREVGYVPHPEIGRLMHLLRARRMASYQATLAFLSFSHDANAAQHLHRYTADVIAGARERAGTLGYAVDMLHIDSARLSQARLTTMLKSRGIRGVLIPPLDAIEDCSSLLDWKQFSIVAATYSAQNLIVNRVVPHHQNNIMLALSRLRALGYSRLGLVLTGDLVLRANFAYQAAFALHQQAGDFATIPALTLDHADTAQSAETVNEWLRQYRPDVLITVENGVTILRSLLGRRFPQHEGLCLLDHNGAGPLSGIQQHPRMIGETAVDLLAGQVQRGEFGFEIHPRVTMVEGGWLPGGLKRKKCRAVE